MANSETFTRRIERELRVFLAIFKRNRLLATLIFVGGVIFVVYQVSVFSPEAKKSSDEVALKVLEQARAYQELFKEYMKVNEQLIKQNTFEAEKKINALKRELDKSARGIEKNTAKLSAIRRLPPENGGVELAPTSVVQAWKACVVGANGAGSGCDAVLSSGLFPVYRLARSPACGVEKYIDGNPVYNQCRHPSHGVNSGGK